MVFWPVYQIPHPIYIGRASKLTGLVEAAHPPLEGPKGPSSYGFARLGQQLLSSMKIPFGTLSTTLGVATALLRQQTSNGRIPHPRIVDHNISILFAVRELAKTLIVATYPSALGSVRAWNTKPLCDSLNYINEFRTSGLNSNRQQDAQDGLTALFHFFERNTLIQSHFQPLRHFFCERVGIVTQWKTTRNGCGHVTDSHRYRNYVLPVNFSASNRETSVQALLNNYLREETGIRVQCIPCSLPSTPCNRKMETLETSEYLFLSLKRFESNQNGSRARKITHKVRANASISLPVRSLNHDGSLRAATNQRYRLIGQCLHHGSTLQGGHYTAERLTDENWFRCSDSTITNITGFTSRTRTSYIVLYKREDNPSPAPQRRRLNDSNESVAARRRRSSSNANAGNSPEKVNPPPSAGAPTTPSSSKYDEAFMKERDRPFNEVDHSAFLKTFDEAAHGAAHKQAQIKEDALKFCNSQSKYQFRRCSRCHVGWFVNERLKDKLDEYKCRSCRRSKKYQEKFSEENNMIPGQPPTWAQDLTQMEEMIVAPILPFMLVHQLKGGQLGMKGNVIQFKQHTHTLATKLPRLPKEVKFILIKPRGKNHKHDPEVKSRYKVRRAKIESFLKNAIKTNHPAYRDISYDALRLQEWPEDDVPESITVIEESEKGKDDKKQKGEEKKDSDGDVIMKDNNNQSGSGEPEGFDDGFDPQADPDDKADYQCVIDMPLNKQREEDAIKDIVDTELTQQDRHDNPINEFDEEYLLSKLFPTLFANGGKGDPFAPGFARSTPVEPKECFRYLLKTSYMRKSEFDPSKMIKYAPFAEHPRFKFWCHSYLKRHTALNQAKFFMKQNKKEMNMTVEDLQREIDNKNTKTPDFLRKLQRYSAQVTGSSSYRWRELQKLKSLCKEDDCGTFFWTASYADYNCPHLHRILGTQNASKAEKRAAVRNNPHITAAYRAQRMRDWVKHVLRNAFGCDWNWWRTEFQARGTGHAHGMGHMMSDPNLRKLCTIGYRGHLASKQLEAKKDNLTAEEKATLEKEVKLGKDAEHRVISFVDTLVQTMNPIKQPVRENWAFPSANHPCEKTYTDADNSKDHTQEYADLINVCERHTRCGPCCLRKKPKSSDWKCRFHFPYELRDKTEILYEARKNSLDPKVTIATKRNDPLLNHHNRVMLETWRSNIDVQPIVDFQACVNYLAKYAAKCEKKSERVNATLQVLSKKLKTTCSTQSAFRKMMIACSTQRDISGQEACHEILGEALVNHPQHRFEDVNLAPGRSVKIAKKGTKVFPNKLDVYANRDDYGLTCEDMSLNTFVRHYNIRSLKAKDGPKITPDTNKRSKKIIHYFPKFSGKRNGKKFAEFCKLELVKYRPWTEKRDNAWDNLEEDEEIIGLYDEFMLSDSAVECVPESVRIAAQRELLGPEDEGEAMQVAENADGDVPDWILASRNVGGTDNAEIDFDFEVDKDYDWSKDYRNYSVSDISKMPTWLADMKAEHSNKFQRVLDTVDINKLNTKQTIAYNKVVNHWNLWKEDKTLDNLKMTVFGTAGTGKSYLIKAIKQTLKDNCILLGTTGVAADNIAGSTMHSTLKLPIGNMRRKDLGAQALKNMQRNVDPAKHHCIVIDEISMCDQEEFYWIDRRLRQCSGQMDKLFGGFSVILLGDFAQLPPVCGSPLYKETTHDGYRLYREFIHTITLDTVVRQAGNDQLAFRNALWKLQQGKVSKKEWELFNSRDHSKVSSFPREWTDAWRIFSTNNDVDLYNYERLKSHQSKETPVAPINSVNNCNKAKAASWRDAGNLRRHLNICKGARVMITDNLWTEAGLVNGSIGHVREIIYSPGKMPRDLPLAVMVEVPGYTGPSFFSDDESKRNLVPVVPVTRRFNEMRKVPHQRTMLPLTLAWAITIHKSQGLTLDKVVVDTGKIEFAAGITFVAFSRVRKLSDIIIKSYPFERYKRIANGKMLYERKEEQKRLRAMQMTSA